MRALALVAVIAACSANAGINRWTIDGPRGGAARGFAVDPSNVSVIYAAAPNGLYRSADGGQKWTAVPELAGTPVSDVVVTPADPSKVFAATTYGLFKSDDHGLTWRNLALFAVSYHVAVSATNANLVYSVGTSGPVISADGGVTFGPAGTGFAVAPVSAVRVDPQTPSTAYISLNSSDGVYKTVDSGAHWTAANHGLAVAVYSIELDPTNGGTLYAAGEGGIYKSTDGGGSWSVLNVVDSIGYAYGLAINRAAPSTILAATAKGLFKSADGGAHWSALALTNFVVCAVFDSADGMNIVASANYTLYRSTDGGVTATESSAGFTSFYTQALAADPHDGAIAYASGPEGTYRSSDHGKTWTMLTSRVGSTFAIDATDSRTLYLLYFTALFRSTDGGVTWDGFGGGLPEAQTTAIASAPGIHGRLYAISGGTIYRRDGEQAWTALTNGLPTENVAFIAFDPSNGQTMFAAVPDGLFRSVDGGSNWSASTLPAGFAPKALAVDPFDARHMFAWSDSALYVTSDGAVSWSSVDTVYSAGIVFDPTRRGRVYLSSDASLQGSGNGGKTWTKFSYGLGRTHGELLVAGADGTLYTGGINGGVSVLQFGRRESVKR